MKKYKILAIDSSLKINKKIPNILNENLQCKLVLESTTFNLASVEFIKKIKPNFVFLFKDNISLKNLNLVHEITKKLNINLLVVSKEINPKLLIATNLNNNLYFLRIKDLNSKNLMSIINKANQETDLITQIKSKDKELRKTKKQLNNKNHFFANISHEIRTPLNGIVGFLDVLLNTMDECLEKEYLKLCKESSNHLEYLINDLLDYSKIEEGKLSLEEKEFNVSVAIEQSICLCNANALEKDISIDLKNTNFKNYNVVGDQYRLKQILINLLSNAIKFSKKSSKITIDCNFNELKNGKIEFGCRVMDTGIGIPKTKLKTILKPFTQAENSTAREFGGTGLGLAITHNLVKQMGGDLKVESTLGKGSIFFFNIIFSKPIISKQIIKQSNLKKVLVAEDNAINRRLIEAIFKDSCYQLSFVTNGEEAVASHKKNNFDLILMDVNMPVLDGFSATTKIRELDKVIPILALSAENQSEIKEKIDKTGMNGYLSKPIDREDLFNKLKTYTE